MTQSEFHLKNWRQSWQHRQWQWSNRRRRWVAVRYNLLHRFPFLTWPGRLLGALLVISLLAALVLVASLEVGVFGKLPNRAALAGITNFLASEVLADDGTVLGRFYLENRSNATYDEISPAFIHALIATEDARFFVHDGVDLRSWLRVLFKTVLLNDAASGGGSTLSQQLTKNIYPREHYPFASLLINKLREVLIARRLELLYSKEEILELYLNTVSFSENTFGIKVAAQRFFNTAPDRLDAAQSAVLVAMLKAPSTYDPVRHPGRSLERRNLVLRQMTHYGYLAPAAADSVMAEPLCLEYFPLDHDYGPATYFREHLRLEVKELLRDRRKANGTAYNLYTDGLRIYTTINPFLQYYAEEAVQKHMAELQQSFDVHLEGDMPWELDTVLYLAKHRSARYRNLRLRGLPAPVIDSIFHTPVRMKIFSWEQGEQWTEMSPIDSLRYYLGLLNAGMLAMEPATGEVKAWVGGIDYQFLKYDHVKSRRQVGSTFKPLVYATALSQGIPPCAYTLNTLRTYANYGFWTPRNATNRYGGFFSMEGGLINSINTVTVNLAMRAKPRNVAALANRMGIDREVPRRPAIALGAVDASLLDMVTVYGTFANRGRRPRLHYIRRIETAGGQVLIDSKPLRDTCNWDQPLRADHADMINQMLRAAVDRGTGRRLRWRFELTNDLAGKTGTSQNHSDGWFMGYNPALVTGIWVGADSPGVRFRNLRLGQGANTALPIYGHFVRALNQDPYHRHYVNTPFPEPADSVKVMLNCANIVYPGDGLVDSLKTKKPLAISPLRPSAPGLPPISATVNTAGTPTAAQTTGQEGRQN